MCLSLNTDGNFAGLGDNADLTGSVDHVADYLSLRIRTYSSGSFSCRNGFHFIILHLINVYCVSELLKRTDN